MAGWAGAVQSGMASGGGGGAEGALSGLIAPMIGSGMNAMSASKAHDRQKNMMTRHWQYEQIALAEAGINPGYIFAGKGAGQGGSGGKGATVQQQHPYPAGASNQYLAGKENKAQVNLMQAQTDAQKALKGKNEAEGVKASVDAYIHLQDAPRAEALGTFFSSPQGKSILEAIEINRSNPLNAWGAGNQALRGMDTNKMPAEVEALIGGAAGIPNNVYEALKKIFPEYFNVPGRNK